jgi:triosephosphate isomerase
VFVRKRIGEMCGQSAADNLIIQYGGSVKRDNVPALLHQPDVDGALVGGASLKVDDFLTIISASIQT